MSCDRCHTNAPLEGHGGRMLCFDCRNEVPEQLEQVVKILLQGYSADPDTHDHHKKMHHAAQSLLAARKREYIDERLKHFCIERKEPHVLCEPTAYMVTWGMGDKAFYATKREAGRREAELYENGWENTKITLLYSEEE